MARTPIQRAAGPCRRGLESPISTPMSIRVAQIRWGGGVLHGCARRLLSQSRQGGWQPHQAGKPAGAPLGPTCSLGFSESSFSQGLRTPLYSEWPSPPFFSGSLSRGI